MDPIIMIARPNAIFLNLTKKSKQTKSLLSLRTTETSHGQANSAECG
jgi:hypothetical protein